MLNLCNTLSIPCIPFFADIRTFFLYKLLKSFIYCIFTETRAYFNLPPSIVYWLLYSQSAARWRHCAAILPLNVRVICKTSALRRQHQSHSEPFSMFWIPFLFILCTFLKTLEINKSVLLLIWCFPIPFCNTLSAYCFAETHPLLHFLKQYLHFELFFYSFVEHVVI